MENNFNLLLQKHKEAHTLSNALVDYYSQEYNLDWSEVADLLSEAESTPPDLTFKEFIFYLEKMQREKKQ